MKMISWIVIAILIVVGIIALKLNHLRHRMFILGLIIFALFLYTSMNVIAEKNNLDFKSSDGIIDAIKLYVGWLANGFDNMRSLVGNIVKMDWSSVNGTFFDK